MTFDASILSLLFEMQFTMHLSFGVRVFSHEKRCIDVRTSIRCKKTKQEKCIFRSCLFTCHRCTFWWIAMWSRSMVQIACSHWFRKAILQNVSWCRSMWQYYDAACSRLKCQMETKQNIIVLFFCFFFLFIHNALTLPTISSICNVFWSKNNIESRTQRPIKHESRHTNS